MDQTLELANFRGNDEPCLVEAALACRACLSSDVEWSLLVDDFEGQVECRCRVVRLPADGLAHLRADAQAVAAAGLTPQPCRNQRDV